MQDNSWKLNFRAWEFALLLVCIVLALFVAYFFGFRAGHAVGYDDALTKAIKNTPRLSVFEDAPKELDEDDLNQLYAKVVEQPKTNLAEEADENIPEEAVKEAEVEPDLAALEEDFKKQQESQAKPEAETAMEQSPAEEEIDLQDLAAKEIIIEPAIPEVIPNQEIQPIENIPPVENSFTETEKKIEAKIETKTVEVKPVQPAQETIKEITIATPEPKPTVAPVTPVIKTVFAPGWYVQVATSKNRESAEKLSRDLYSSGFKSTIETYKIANNEFFRVLVGPESQKPYAERLVDQLGKERFLSGKPFIKEIR